MIQFIFSLLELQPHFIFTGREDSIADNFDEMQQGSQETVLIDFNETPRKMFPCPKCPSSFRQKPSLTRHIKYECSQPPRFCCPYCSHRSKKTSDIYVHVRRRHVDCQVFAIDILGDASDGSLHRMP